MDKLNWRPQQTPNSTSDCQVNPASTAAISVGNATINSLDTNANATLTVVSTDTLTILGAPDASNATGASTNSGTIALSSACDLFLDGLFTNAGALNTANGSDVWVNSSFSNTGAVNQSGDVTVGQTHAGAVTNSATWSITGAHDIAKGAAGGTFTNEGTLTRSGTGVSDVGVATANSGAVGVKQGKLEFSSTVTNTGTMTATGSVLELTQAVSGAGALDIGTGGVMDIVRGKDAGQTVDFLGTGKLKLIRGDVCGPHQRLQGQRPDRSGEHGRHSRELLGRRPDGVRRLGRRGAPQLQRQLLHLELQPRQRFTRWNAH